MNNLEYIKNRFVSSSQHLLKLSNNNELLEKINLLAVKCTEAIENGNKLLFIGNGGSAADSQHLAAELVSRFAYDRPGLPAFALTVDSSALTAIGNDYGYDKLFSRQVQAVAKPNDILFAISTSGRSENILNGVLEAKKLGVVTVGLTGNQKAHLTEIVDYVLEADSDETPIIQEAHIVIGHTLCGLIEQMMYPKN